jgi:hypothetical protein
MSKGGGVVVKVASPQIRYVDISQRNVITLTCIYHKVFFQRYFAQKHGKEQVKAAKVDKRKANHHDSDMESDGAIEDGSRDEDSDAEEAAIWKVRPT